MRVFLAILAVGFVMAAFGAWREQLLNIKATRGIVGHLNGMIFREGSGVTGESPGIVVSLSLINAGPPTTLLGFNATFKSDNSEIEARSAYLPENFVFNFPGRGATTLPRSEMMFEKLKNPIVTGGRVDGFVLYELRGWKKEDIVHKRLHMKIQFRDVSGNKYSVGGSTVLDAKQGAYPTLIPGLNDPFLPILGIPPAEKSPSPNN
jgi:hypothetical protein